MALRSKGGARIEAFGRQHLQRPDAPRSVSHTHLGSTCATVSGDSRNAASTAAHPTASNPARKPSTPTTIMTAPSFQDSTDCRGGLAPKVPQMKDVRP